MLILIMDGISKEILDNEQLIDTNYNLYREKAKTLGLVALKDKDKLNILIGNSLLSDLEIKAQKKDELSSIVAKRKELKAVIEEERKDAFLNRQKVDQLEEQKVAVLSRLGAVALVQAQSEVADSEIIALLKSDIEEERKAFEESQSSSFFTRTRGKMKLNELKKNQAKRVLSIGKKIEENNLIGKIKGDNALSFLQEIENINSSISHYQRELENLTNHLEIKEDEKLTAINYKEQLEEAELHLAEAAISYGLYLFENGSKWISENTPELELDLLASMLDLQKENELIAERIKECQKEITIDELSMLIANDKKSIELLLVEKCKIDEEIEKINEHITLINDKIKDIRQKL